MSKQHLLESFALGSVLLLFCGCRASENNQPTTRTANEPRTIMSSHIEIGEQRVFTGRGPRYRLPDEYYQCVREHPAMAMELLKQRLKVDNANVRCNAYDFITALLDVPSTREEALSILTAATHNEGFAIKEFLAPVVAKASSHWTPHPIPTSPVTP